MLFVKHKLMLIMEVRIK
nr:unnamed protein product [Callosobruchus chinensis]